MNRIPLLSRRRGVGVVQLALATALLWRGNLQAGTFSATLLRDSLVDARGMTLATGAPYGTSINGGAYEIETAVTSNGYQYTAYWAKDESGPAPAYYVAVGRRAVGTPTWETLNLTASNFRNGMKSASDQRPWDAHNVVSIGVAPADGTIHLAYDLHGHTMRYRVSTPGAATNPASVAWTASLFNAETAKVGTTSNITGVTYPAFVVTPNNDLQLFYRTGGSGAGSLNLSTYRYNSTTSTSAWTVPYQFDDGLVGTYSPVGSTRRNAYPNGFTYGPDSRLHVSFVYRENTNEGGNGTNHDISYVYSDDLGVTWKNNAGTTISDRSPATTTIPDRWTLNSPGLVIAPLSQESSLMNQQGQAADSQGHIHAALWHLDLADAPTSSGFNPAVSSYFHYWRDATGNWRRNTIDANGSWGRPRLYFDSNDNLIATYSNAGARIAIASRESNWTDWTVVRTDTGYFSDAPADTAMLRQHGVLSLMVQKTPTASLQATEIRARDYTVSYTPNVVNRFSPTTGSYTASTNWSTGTLPGTAHTAIIDSGRAATISTSSGTLGGSLVLGTASGPGTLAITAGTTTVTGSIIVGRDGGPSGSGTYTQTGGVVAARRMVVGDYYSDASSGGKSAATILGGSLTLSELQIAVGISTTSGSVFNVAGGTVTVNGDVILADAGNTGTIDLTGGTLIVKGNLTHGNNKANTAVLSLRGGTLDMTGNSINVATLNTETGRLLNLRELNSGATLTKNSPGTLTLGGSSSFTSAVAITTGTLRLESATGLGSTTGTTSISGGTATGTLELAGNITTTEPIVIGGRQPAGPGADAPHVLNTSGTNTLTGPLTTGSGGNQYNIQSDAGLLILSNGLTFSFLTTPPSERSLKLSGAGNGLISGPLSNGTQLLSLIKSGTGTWALTGSLSYTRSTTVNAGHLIVQTPLRTVASSLLVTGPGVTTLATTPTLVSAPGYTVAGEFAAITVNASSAATGLVSIPAINRTTHKASVVVASGLTIAGGTLDLGTSDLILKGGAASISTVHAWATSGALAASGSLASSTHYVPFTTLAVFANDAGSGVAYFPSYNGVTISAGDVIVKFTYVGDLNLDGRLDGNDFARLIEGYSTGHSGWGWGDVDNSGGAVSLADFSAFLTAYTYYLTNPQLNLGTGQSLSTPSGLIPEPSAATLLLALLSTASRRRLQ